MCHEAPEWDKKLFLTLHTNEIGIIKRYNDASYAIHDDCRGHMGAMATLGHGAITSFSHKQRIHAKSSTKNELIRVDEASPQTLWT